ncbi:unnamed protein product [Ceutorhynchus assimilis]|uniref:Vacuolar ATPase assembly protein VMA22 n=1 Tax=Ceutorhynchus assimilis TaxID=467358 RepID=A0A9N9QSG7_9CUCU|nr:unnamed protein product [Ceutorhynchus assimilis]
MTTNTNDIDKIRSTLDRLTLDALTLMQEEIELKINAENAMVGGETHLAKTRYILGQNSVSSIQLPTENTPEFDALLVVHHSQDEYGHEKLDLESQKPDNEHHINPIKWFGYMQPQHLQLAQNLYRQAVQWLVQAANVQLRLRGTCLQIKQLRKLKEEVAAEE